MEESFLKVIHRIWDIMVHKPEFFGKTVGMTAGTGRKLK
jgi:hypothetical protein